MNFSFTCELYSYYTNNFHSSRTLCLQCLVLEAGLLQSFYLLSVYVSKLLLIT